MKPDTGLVLTTYNRPHYLAACLESLRESALEGTALVIVDDGSDDADTLSLVKGFSMPGVPITRLFRPESRSFDVHLCLKEGWDLALCRWECRFLANLDGDAIVKPDWMIRLRDLFIERKATHGPLIATGFHSKIHGVVDEADDFRIKESVGGLGLFFDSELYHEVIRPNLELYWDDKVVEAMRSNGFPMLCTKPSVIQHIGQFGRFSNAGVGFDRAADFELTQGQTNGRRSCDESA